MRRKSYGGRLCFLIATILTLQLILPPHANSEEVTSAESLSFTLYHDGYVFVEYVLRANPKLPMANVTVFGEVLLDVVVVDEADLPIDYTLDNGELTIYALGVEHIGISYYTHDLTEKDGRFWTFNVTVPMNTSVILPTGAMLVGFNQIPELIESNGDQILLLMHAGIVEVTYVTSVLGTREHAQIVISEAEKTIMEIKARNLTVTAAESTLQKAKDYFSHGDYTEAETYGKKAIDLANQTNQTAAQAGSTLEVAEKEILKAEKEGRTTRINEAKNLLDQSRSAYSTGDYNLALALASQSQVVSKASVAQFPIVEVSGAIAFTVVVGYVLIKHRHRALVQKTPRKRKPIDIERIFKLNQLRPEEQDAIRLIAENNGELMEAELYNKLSLPRTTTWRMVKRLEEMGIVEITKIRRDNLIRLKK